MQGQYGTSTRKAICQFVVSATSTGQATLKAALNCSLVGTPNGIVSVNGVNTTVTTTSAGVYLIQLADGPVVVGGATSSGDNDNNTAPTVNQFGQAPQECDVSFTAVAGQIQLTFKTSGTATSPATGALINALFDSCYDGNTNTP